MQEREEHECREINCFHCKESHITRDKEKCNKYRKEWDIMNKLMGEKCDVYKAKGILGYWREKIYSSAAKDSKWKKSSLDKERESTNRIEMGSRARAKKSFQTRKGTGLWTSSLGPDKKERKRTGESHEIKKEKKQGKHRERK